MEKNKKIHYDKVLMRFFHDESFHHCADQNEFFVFEFTYYFIKTFSRATAWCAKYI